MMECWVTEHSEQGKSDIPIFQYSNTPDFVATLNPLRPPSSSSDRPGACTVEVVAVEDDAM